MTSQRDYRLELRQSSTFAGVSSILVKSSIISGLNPEQRIYRPKKVTTIFCICNQPVRHLVPMAWHTAH